MTALNSEGLLPCPFCGGDAIIFQNALAKHIWRVQCLNCDAAPSGQLGKEASIAAWNRRTLPPVDGLEVVAFRHPEAGWAHVQYSEIDMHCRKDGLRPIPLVALSQASSVIAGLTAERDREISRKEHTQQWYAERLSKIEDVAKREGLWDEVAAIIANGSGTRQLADGSFVYDPPNYAQQLNSAKHRAETAEARISSLEEENKRLRDALKQPFSVLFLDGRNEHGTHVLPLPLRSLPDEFLNGPELEEMAEQIMSEAEKLGFSECDAVWTEFRWIDPQTGDEGRVELAGYWEFARIIPELSQRAEIQMEDHNG